MQFYNGQVCHLERPIDIIYSELKTNAKSRTKKGQIKNKAFGGIYIQT